MKSTLQEVLLKLQTKQTFNQLMRDKKYTNKDLIHTIAEENILNDIYKIESFNTLNNLLMKTHFRLLLDINKGMNNLVNIINNPSDWGINPISKDNNAWIDNNVLIFSTETSQAVFSHISRGKCEYNFQNNKWQ